MIKYRIYLKGQPQVFTDLETDVQLNIGERIYLAQTENEIYKVVEMETRFTYINGIHIAYEKIAVVVKCEPTGT